MDREEIRQVLGHDPLTFEQMKELQQMQLQHDWEALRNQAAIAALQGVLSNPSLYVGEGDTFPKVAVRYADALVDELRKGQ